MPHGVPALNRRDSIMTPDPQATATMGHAASMQRFETGRRALTQARGPLILFAFFVLLIVIGNALAPGFAAPNSLLQLLKLASFMGIVAIGQTLVMLPSRIDLSAAWTLTAAA